MLALRLVTPAAIALAALLGLTTAPSVQAAQAQKKGLRAKPTVDRHVPGRATALHAVAGRDTLQRFAAEVAARRNLPQPWVEHQLAPALSLSRVRQLIMPPPAGTSKDWTAYRSRFIEPRRVAAGAAFWREHRAWLELAEQRWGVPPELVVGIVGVETFYGGIMGSFRVLDALATLAFDFPPGRKDRSALFRDELEELLVLAHREGVAASSLQGSYAGAIGLPQFLPSSINRWAVDFDDDGHVDLRRSAADTIGSVAHYLAAFGWVQGLPTHFDVAVPVDTSERAALLAPDILPSFTPAEFIARGARLPEAALAHDGLLALVELQNRESAPSYVAGTSNFYAVTRYNRSSYYAMAVIELGRAVRREIEREAPAAVTPPSAPGSRG